MISHQELEKRRPELQLRKGMVQEAHELFIMIYGTIRASQQKHPVPDAPRSYLRTFFFVIWGKMRSLFMHASRKFTWIGNTQ